MNMPLPNTLRRLDRHWLLNHPILWILRLHWMVYFGGFGLVLICLLALALPVSLQSVHSLNTYFLGVLTLAGLAVSPWIYLQVRLAPQLRQNSRGWTAVYLLAGYLFIFGVYLAWPYAFVGILESKISSRISAIEVQNDLHTIRGIRNFLQILERNGGTMPVDPTSQLKQQGIYQVFQDLSLKYLQRDASRLKIFGDISRVDDINGVAALIWLTAGYVSKIKDDYIDFLDPRDYYRGEWLVWGTLIILPLVLVLRSFQATDMKSLLTTLVLGVAVLVVLVLYGSSAFPGADKGVLGAIFMLFAAGGGAILHAPRRKRKSLLHAVGMNVFSLLLPWMPFISVLFFDGVVRDDILNTGDELYLKLLALGVVILFAVTPWIQRKYLVLQAKPS